MLYINTGLLNKAQYIQQYLSFGWNEGKFVFRLIQNGDGVRTVPFELSLFIQNPNSILIFVTNKQADEELKLLHGHYQ